MVALTKGRGTPKRAGDDFSDPIEAASTIFQGGLVCLNAAGNAVKGQTALNLKARGIAKATVVNAGAAGAERVESEKGLHKFFNSAAGDLITRAHIDTLTCFIVDDQTVAATNGGGTRSTLGVVKQIDADGGVWVLIV